MEIQEELSTELRELINSLTGADTAEFYDLAARMDSEGVEAGELDEFADYAQSVGYDREKLEEDYPKTAVFDDAGDQIQNTLVQEGSALTWIDKYAEV